MVRREVFRRMQEAFHENGIEFAHRNVTVYLPSQTEESKEEEGKEAGKAPSPDKKTLEAAAAAAALAAEQAEAEKLPPEKKK